MNLSNAERDVMRVVRTTPSPTRSELTALTHLSQQSIHRLIDQLSARGLLRVGETIVRGRGKPSPVIEIENRFHVSLGIMIGTEHLRFAAMANTGQILQTGALSADPTSIPNAIDAVSVLVSQWRKEQTGRELIGLGIAAQGFRTREPDAFYPPEQLSNWRGVKIAQLFAEALNIPTFTENNASASAVAEHYLAPEPYTALAYLAFNSGFGAGLVYKGTTMTGGHGNAGEISELFTLGQMAHRPALGELIKRYRAKGESIHSLNSLISNFSSDDGVFREWLEEIRPNLHLALRALKTVADPQVIYFGGDAPESLREALIAESRGAFDGHSCPEPILAQSAVAGDSAHIGAAYLPLNSLIF